MAPDTLSQRLDHPEDGPRRRQYRPQRRQQLAVWQSAGCGQAPAPRPQAYLRRPARKIWSAFWLAAFAAASAARHRPRRAASWPRPGSPWRRPTRSTSAARRSPTAAIRCRPWWRSRPVPATRQRPPPAGARVWSFFIWISPYPVAEPIRSISSELTRRGCPVLRPRSDRGGPDGFAAGPVGIMAGSRSASRSPPAARSPRSPGR